MTRSPVDIHHSFARRRLSRETSVRGIESSPRQSRPSLEKSSSPAIAAGGSTSSASDSEEAAHPMLRSRNYSRRPRYPSTKATHALSDADEEDEDSTPFLPFSGAPADVSPSKTPTPNDPGATMKPTPSRPPTVRPRPPSSPALRKGDPRPTQQGQHSSSSSAQSQPKSNQQRPSPRQGPASTLSPRQRRAVREGNSRSPSIGSRFSDLDDASVTQSALEEALANELGQGGMASKMSTISQALKSRYLGDGNFR